MEKDTAKNRGEKCKRRELLLFAMLMAMFLSSGCAANKGQEVKTEKADAWIDTMMISEKDGKPHKVQVKLVSIDRSEKNVQKAIDEYNRTPTSGIIEPLSSEDKAYGLVKYQVKIPEDFPVLIHGVNDPSLDFTIVDKYGKNGIEIGNTTYEGLNQTWEIGHLPSGYTLPPGNVYDGAFIFVMVKDFEDYVIKQSTPGENEGEETVVYFKGA